MISLLIAVLTLGLAGTVVGGVVTLLSEPSWSLRIAFCCLLVLGVCAGVAGLSVEYQPSPTFRYGGVPFPVVIFHLENGNWVDYVGGPGIIIDLIVTPAIVAAPASIPLIVRSLRRRRSRQRLLDGYCRNCTYDLTGNTSGVCPECGTPVPKAPADKSPRPA